MDTTVQRATQKINRKLLLSESTKNKFQKSSFLLFWGQVGWQRQERKVLLMLKNHVHRKKQFPFSAATRRHRDCRQPQVMNAKPSKAEAGYRTLQCPRGSDPHESQPVLAEFYGETWVTMAEGETPNGQECPAWPQSCTLSENPCSPRGPAQVLFPGPQPPTCPMGITPCPSAHISIHIV